MKKNLENPHLLVINGEREGGDSQSMYLKKYFIYKGLSIMCEYKYIPDNVIAYYELASIWHRVGKCFGIHFDIVHTL